MRTEIVGLLEAEAARVVEERGARAGQRAAEVAQRARARHELARLAAQIRRLQRRVVLRALRVDVDRRLPLSARFRREARPRMRSCANATIFCN